MNEIESKENKLKMAIKDGSDLMGLFYNEDILSLTASYVYKNYSNVTPTELFKYFEDKALSGDVEVGRLSGMFVSKLINSHKKTVYK